MKRAFVLAALCVAACDDRDHREPDGAPDAPPLGVLAILPAELRLPVGRAHHFVAPGATAFVVEEPGGGTVTSDGRYDAPLAPGTYHVRAENDSARGVATVHVDAMRLEVIAGHPGGPGSADGVGADARFDRPYGVAADGAGSIYVTDAIAETIRKIDLATGEVRIVAGTPYTSGTADGAGAQARFSVPWGLAHDAATGTLFVADNASHVIRRIDLATATVTTIAGTPGTSGASDGIGPAARFLWPMGLAFVTGNLYIADSGNHAIRVLNVATGAVTTVCGTPGTKGSDGTHLDSPSGVALAGRHLYIADHDNHAIRRYDLVSGGAITTWAGLVDTAGFADAAGTAARFNHPTALAVSGSTLYVADHQNARIRVIAGDQTVTTLAGSGTFGWLDGAAAAARFKDVIGVAVVGSDVLVADGLNRTVRRIGAGAVTTLAGRTDELGTTDGSPAVALLGRVTDVAIAADDTLYYADELFHTVRRIASTDHTVTTIAGTAFASGQTGGIGAAARFSSPRNVALDGDALYVTDAGAKTVRRIALPTVTVDAPIAATTGIAASTVVARGGLYVSSAHVIERIDLATHAVTVAFGSGTGATVDGIGTAASLHGPAGLATDGAARLFVAERQGATIRMIDLDTNAVTTLAGMPATRGHADGIGAAARFDLPWGVAYDRTSEQLYVADSAHVIRRIYVPTGAVSTIAGLVGVGGVRPGPIETAALNSPTGIGILSDGSLVITNRNEPVVLRLAP